MFEKAKEILLNYTDTAEIAKESLLGADLGLSSFDVVSIVMEFEEKFQIEISDRDIGKFLSVQDILDYLKAHGV